ncbi:MAG: hypothetical protein OEW87_13545 [Flavobacteriaceae bacterium]|nr:hypothetical protein [Flavobacteriaceae bacterium]
MLKAILVFLFTANVYALPQRVEVWFLSASKTSFLESILEPNFRPGDIYSQASTKLQCQQMGDYCFDPQVGLYKRGDENKALDLIDYGELDKKQKYDFFDTPKGVERNMIECDENPDFFDVFCGKMKKIKRKKTKLEVWVDVSSTMRQIDLANYGEGCSREDFLKKLTLTCPMGAGLKVYSFTEYRKEVSTLHYACKHDGLNNMKRLIKDIEKSNVKNLIVITDIFEAESSFIDALKSLGKNKVHLKGIDKPLYANKIQSQLQRVRKLCK